MTAEDEAQFSAVIDEILEASDLNTISRKTITKGLETEIGRDLSHSKVGILSLVRGIGISDPESTAYWRAAYRATGVPALCL